MAFLDSVLDTLHSDAWVYCIVRGGPDWGLRVPASPTAQFHSVRSGRCWITVDNQTSVELRPGDFAVLPHGSEHRVLDHPNSRAVDLLDAVNVRPDPTRSVLELGDGNPHTQLVCGGFQLTRHGPNPLHELPPLVTLRATGPNNIAALDTILEIAATELSNPRFGSDIALTSVGRLLLIETLRTVSNDLPQGHTGLLAASRDERLTAVLDAIHANPELNWTVESLAKIASTSRSTLTARFRQATGTTITQYLTEWRMTVAGALLEDTNDPLGPIAAAVGYGSEAAFSRAYKRQRGTSPGAHRDHMRAQRTAQERDPTTRLPPLFQAAIAENA